MLGVLSRAVGSRTIRQVGKTGLRSFATKSKVYGRRRFAIATGTAGIGVIGYTIYGFTLAAGARSVPDWKQIRQEISDLIDDETVVNPSVDEGVQGGGGYVAPLLMRLAWHCSGTWCKHAQNGGSDGATMRFKPESDHGGNAGLAIARELLEPIKAKHPEISYADLYILAGVVAIEEMGGPVVPFRYGRSDAEGPADFKDDSRFSPDGRLPDGDKDAQHVRDIFYRMGFDDHGIVALLGAHSVGRCHTDRSGFWGPWSRSESTFSNEYYRFMVEEEWVEKTTHNGGEWKGPKQFENKEGDLMMLSTDLALITDPKFRVWTEKYVKDEELFFKDFTLYYQQLNELGCKDLIDEEK